MAKMFKYAQYEACCTTAFVVFVVTWLIFRHIFYPLLCWSIFKSVPSRMAYGCYSRKTVEIISTDGYPDAWRHMFSPFHDLEGAICMNRSIKWIFLSFLLSIQSLSIVWFTMILRVIVGVIRTGNAEDTRSDDEEEEVVEKGGAGKGVKNGNVMMMDGGASGGATSSTSEWRRSNGSSSSSVRTGRGRVRLGDQNDRKALLGRIGCEKPVS